MPCEPVGAFHQVLKVSDFSTYQRVARSLVRTRASPRSGNSDVGLGTRLQWGDGTQGAIGEGGAVRVTSAGWINALTYLLDV